MATDSRRGESDHRGAFRCASAPVGTGGCPGVRPGGQLITNFGLCTLNFLFRDADGRRIGEFAYGTLESHGTGIANVYTKNFALIRLDPGIEASPEMCYFGGPRGLFATDTAGPLVLQYYGNGDTIGTVLPARSGVTQGTPNPDYIYATGLALAGDGGSGVMTADGLAMGILVTSVPTAWDGPPSLRGPRPPIWKTTRARSG